MSPIELPARIPPHNLDAERAVLGAVLLEGRDALPRVVEVLRPSDFYTEAHRAIYQSMLTLFDHGEPVDLLTLQEDLRRTDQLSLVGGPAALALLVEQGSVAAYLSSYTVIVRDMGVPLVVLNSPYRMLVGPLMEYIDQLRRLRGENHVVTIVLPEFIPAKWWQQLLHNQTALLIKGQLLFRRNVVVTDVPYHLRN